MKNRGFLGAALEPERAGVVLPLLAAIALSWGYILVGAGMSMDEMDGVIMPMRTGPVTAGYAALVLVMWAVMMSAMMLPSAVPMILFFDAIARHKGARGFTSPAAAAFIGGYLVVWSGFSAAAALVQVGFEASHLVDPMMQASSPFLAAGLLVTAGLYQWSPLKQACLRSCSSPHVFLLMNWRDGPRGAVTMGLRHGAVCVGCCWALMLVLLVGGVMNLAWIGGIALFVLIEKVVPAGPWLARIAGAGLVAWGIATLAAA